MPATPTGENADTMAEVPQARQDAGLTKHRPPPFHAQATAQARRFPIGFHNPLDNNVISGSGGTPKANPSKPAE